MQYLMDIVNWLTNPPILFTVAIVAFFLALRTRWVWTNRFLIIWMSGLTVFFLVSLAHPHFREIVTKGDNIPIVIMVYAVSFFVWLGLKQAYENDERIARGEPTWEASFQGEKEYVWPDLVYIEFLSTLVVGLGLLVWSLFVPAPLEQPADPTNSPNPSKAPWYFLGLQEMLVYYDPWIAGVLLPGLIIIGLMCIPYIDVNPRGNGYYTFRERKAEITLYLFGFLILWCLLIFIGTFLRGPNWNFFGLYEEWDIHKVEPLTNVDLSEYFWIRLLGQPLPAQWYVREAPGLVLVVLYLFALPPFLAKTFLRRYYEKMGFIRYNIFVLLLLIMLSMPIKMYLRWLFNLKYIVHLQEFEFNI